MGNFIKTQNNFARGEISPEFFARDDINGLSELVNMDVIAGGGIRRRAGLRHVVSLPAVARLISFSVSENEKYLLAIGNGHMLIYSPDGDLVADLLVPWSDTAVENLQYAQRVGTMIFVHDNYRPQILQRDDYGLFNISAFMFASTDNMQILMPFMQFDDAADITISVSANSQGNNYATMTTNKSYWSADCVGDYLVLANKQWRIASYISPTQIVAFTNGTYTLPSGAVSDWRVGAFGNQHGWPHSITFYQNRLVFGGSQSWPGGIWMSRVGEYNNFDVGTGLDDEAIFITLLSGQRQQICTVVSSDNLQILTSVGEWAISGNPLTPSTVNIKQHTSIGSVYNRYLAPQVMDGATIFVAHNGRDLRELALDDLSQNYNANDLCALSGHMLCNPVDTAYNDSTHQFFAVNPDGRMAVLTQNKTLAISAWSHYQTDGEIKSVTVLNGTTYVVVVRENNIAIEAFSSDAMSDSGNRSFAFVASGLPIRASGHNAKNFRIRKISVRVLDTKSIVINGQRYSFLHNIYNDDCAGFSGDAVINMLGTQYNGLNAPWRISGTEPFATTIISVTLYGRYAI